MAISAYKDVIVFPNDNTGRVNIKEQAFTASGTWTAPAGVTSAQVILVGAGGGGGGGSASVAGGGGGGGQVVVQNLTVVPGTAYQLNIGAGGQGGIGALYSATDTTTTLPGANGGTTTFGSTTVWNYLTNPDFDYNIMGWDPEAFYRLTVGASGASTVTVYPNALGLVAGMYLLGTGLGTSTQIVSISGNVLTLSVVNASAVNVITRFDLDNARIFPTNTTINVVSAPGVDAVLGTNTFAVNTVGSPYTNTITGTLPPQLLSNNLMPARLAQLEDPRLITDSYIYSQGTNAATISITNAGMPAKITPEMTAGISTTATATSGATTITVANPFGIYPNMMVFTTSGALIGAGTYVIAVSGTSITLNQGTTGALSASTVYFSYNSTLGQNAFLATTASAVSAANPTWLNLSTVNNTSNNTGSSSYVGGYQGIPWVPGATYTISAYVSSNLNVSTATPIIFQLRSAGWSYMAQSNVSYLGSTTATTPVTNSIDGGTQDGFFVRQATASAMTNYGATLNVQGTANSGSTQVTVASATGILVGMTATATGIPASTTVAAVSGTTITLSAQTTQALSNTSITFAMPAGVQILGSTVTNGQTGWRRIYATVTTPTMSTTSTSASNGVYGFSARPQFVYPTIILEQASTSFWFDNIQIEIGSTPTTWQPPVYQQVSSLTLKSNTATNTNLETAHRPVRVVGGNTYAGSLYATASGASPYYVPVYAFIEWMDIDYNVISRSVGSNNFLSINAVDEATQQMPNTNYPTRMGVTATAPSTAYYARLGMTAYQGGRNGTAANIQYNVFYPVLELGSTFTQPKRPDGVNYFWSGQPGASPIINGWVLAAEGGGGGGTYNTNHRHWQYGLEGGNNGGHAANNAYNYLTLAGGGGGSFSVGMPGQAWGQTTNGSTSSQVGSSISRTSGLYSHTFPVRGNLGGFAHIDSGTNAAYVTAQGGDGGLGQLISGLTSGSPLGLTLGGGGGGAGWGSSDTPGLTYPGRGNGGGGKGGPTYIVDEFNNTYYHARGLDATANTGGGGGGGGSTVNNSPFTFVSHTAANAAVNFENWSNDQYKWTGLYNATPIQAGGAAIVSGTYGMQVTIGDSGSAKVVSNWQEFPILPRSILYFPTIAGYLYQAPSGVTSPLYAGFSKRLRPTIRWKDAANNIIREERPAYDIIFTAVTTTTYIGPTAGATQSGGWMTQQAPANAYFFDITWEFDYFDGGDVVYVDTSGLQYLGYLPYGGNGADGYAVVRYFDKTSL